MMQWVQPLHRVLCEEFHNNDVLECEYLRLRCPRGSIFANLDSAQRIHAWKGASASAQIDVLSGKDAEQHQTPQVIVKGEINYRSSRAVNRAASESRARIPLTDGMPPLNINSAPGAKEGMYVAAGGTLANLDRTVTNMIVTRKSYHALLMTMALVAKNIPVMLRGRPNIGHELANMVNILHGTLQARLTHFCVIKSTTSPTDASDDKYDMVCCLITLIHTWTEANPHLNIAEPGDPATMVVELFCDHVEQMYTQSKSNPNVVIVATVHSAQGMEAHTTYVFQPNLLPLEERVAEGGWEEEEERCLEYVAESRAIMNLIKLEILEIVTRQGIDMLFIDQNSTVRDDDAQNNAGGSSQETVDADAEDVSGPTDSDIKKALAILELDCMPVSLMALTTVLRSRAMSVHPDKNNMSFEQASARTALLLEARNLIKAALVKAAAEAAAAPMKET